jgi:hypothetical protein
MTKTVTISALRSDLTPYGNHDVIVTLVAGSAGGVVGSGVVVESTTVPLDANGAGSVALETNDVITPEGTFYRFTVVGSSPTITRSIALTTATASTVAWSLAGIQVGDPTEPQRDVSSTFVTVPDGTMPVVEAGYPPATQSLTNYLAAIDEALDGEAGYIHGAHVHYATFIIDPTTDLTTFTATDILDAYDGSVFSADAPRTDMVGLVVAVTEGANLGLYTVTASGPCTPTVLQPEYGELVGVVAANDANDPATLLAGGSLGGPPTEYRTVLGEGGGGADLSDAIPQALGTAGSGDGTSAARDDHVHAMPSASDVGADPAGTAASAISALNLGTAAQADTTDFATAAHTHTGVYEAAGVAAALVDDLSGVTDTATARTNLGLGGAAVLAVGTTAGTVAAGDDSRFSTGGDTTRRILVTPNQWDRASAGITWSADAGQSIGWGFLNASTGGINDYIEWDVWMPAGTWTLLYYYLTGSSYGIATVSLDGTTLGATIDGYTAGSVRNNVATRTGIVVATAGVKVLKVLMASKNASSSSYRPGTQLFDFRRTA